jgi:hypothetical protein
MTHPSDRLILGVPVEDENHFQMGERVEAHQTLRGNLRPQLDRGRGVPQKSSRRLLRPPRTKPIGIIWNMFGTSSRVQIGLLG